MKGNRFCILITVYNSKEWIGKCIESAINQDYDNFYIVIIDDHSTDGTWEIINKYSDTHIAFVVQNPVRVEHSLISMIDGIANYVHKDDTIVSLDGDDWLSDDQVLNTLNEAYTSDIWLTYGQYEPLSGKYHNYCQPIPDIATYRKSELWCSTHLKTFRKKLWDKIDQADFHYPDGRFIETAGDRAMMYPMIEMAGKDRIKFISRILYIYNDLNPENYMKTSKQLSIDVAEYIQSKPSYKQLSEL